MTTPYFGGEPTHMGQVFSLPYEDFSSLVNEMIRLPVQLPLTREEMMALPDKEQNERKRTSYLVGAVFKSSPSPRQTGQAIACNLLFIDIDDAAEAQRLLNAGFAQALGDLNAVVWHTARSTPEKPRLRVCVPVENVPVEHYGPSVTALAGTLGMNSLNSESKIAVQPMYLPVQYKDSAFDPIAYVKTDGTIFDTSQVMAISALPHTVAPDPAQSGIADITYLRGPDEAVTREIAAEALAKIDPSCSMKLWVEMGMALKHQFGNAGFSLWDDWSANSADKYPGQDEMANRWASFKANPDDRAPVTIRTLVRVAIESGWDDQKIGDETFDKVRSWIRDPDRTTEDLLDHGVMRIAKAWTNLDSFRQKTLVSEMAVTLKGMGVKLSHTDITKEVKKVLAEDARAHTPNPPWASSIAFLTAPNLFYRYVDNRKMRGEVVDLIYKSPDPEKAAREYLVHVVGIPVVENLRYDPAESKRVIVMNNVPYINTYRKTYCRPDATMLMEATELWIEHGKNLYGDPYWITMTDWAAYLVQNPGKKIRWTPLCQSGPGAGKGLHAYQLTLCLGSTNVQRLAAEHILDGAHTGWAFGFQLTVVDEVYPGAGERRDKAMNRLKPLISDDEISIRPIYEPVQQVPNNTNYILFTNHHGAVSVHDDDRRYFYIVSPLQTKADVLALGADYFDRMYSESKRLAPGLRAFLESWPISANFAPEGRAPITPFFSQLVRQSASPLNVAVTDTVEDEPHALVRRDLVSLTALRGSMPEHVRGYSDQALTLILMEKGFVAAGRHLIDGHRHLLFTRGMSPDVAAVNAQMRMDVL